VEFSLGNLPADNLRSSQEMSFLASLLREACTNGMLFVDEELNFRVVSYLCAASKQSCGVFARQTPESKDNRVAISWIESKGNRISFR